MLINYNLIHCRPIFMTSFWCSFFSHYLPYLTIFSFTFLHRLKNFLPSLCPQYPMLSCIKVRKSDRKIYDRFSFHYKSLILYLVPLPLPIFTIYPPFNKLFIILITFVLPKPVNSISSEEVSFFPTSRS